MKSSEHAEVIPETFQVWGAHTPSIKARCWIHAIRHAPPWLRRPISGYFNRNIKDSILPPLDVAVRGVRFRVHYADNTPEYKLVFQGARLDHWHLKHIRRGLSAGSTFVDVGANFGYFSLIAASFMKGRGTIIAIEPNPIMLRRLRENIMLNEFGNIRVEGCAVGNAHGEAVANSAIPDHGSVGFGDKQLAQGQASTVPMLPLLSVMEKNAVKRIDVLKIDIEGFEDRALLPFFASAPKSLWPRLIVMEESSRQKWQVDVMQQLVAIGYEVAAKGRVDCILRLV